MTPEAAASLILGHLLVDSYPKVTPGETCEQTSLSVCPSPASNANELIDEINSFDEAAVVNQAREFQGRGSPACAHRTPLRLCVPIHEGQRLRHPGPIGLAAGK